jgi:hypothetical protein
VRVALSTFACRGVEEYLDSDIAAGVEKALSDYMRRLDSERAPVGIPRFRLDTTPQAAVSVDLPVDERTWTTLRLEAARQGTTVGQLATHSVLVYLAELDRLTPPGGHAA